MIIGSEEHEKWWAEVSLYFRHVDHYMNEFGEHPSMKINRILHAQRKWGLGVL